MEHKRQNTFIYHRRRLSDLIGVDSHDSYHRYLIEDGVKMYRDSLVEDGGSTGGNRDGLGSVLAVCANYREGETLGNFDFSKIVVSGIGEIDAYDGKLQMVVDRDKRISYRKENCERISFPSKSFDFVFCKEGLHHLTRPTQGLYEMLRVCRRAVIFVEPWDGMSNRVFAVLGMTTVYEKNTGVNLDAARDNFVFRWSRRLLCNLLHSYYLDSGFRVDVKLGWMSGRIFHNKPKPIKYAAATVGWIVSLVPGFRGNFATVMIRPGYDIPPDPVLV